MSIELHKLDSHLHLWDLQAGEYAWLTPETGELYRTFSAAEAEAELTASGVSGAILVQAEDTVADTLAMLDVAHTHDWVRGVVGWVPLEDPARAHQQLDDWVASGRVCGIRHLVHVDPRENFLELPEVRLSVRRIAEVGLAFDVPATNTRHLDQVAGLADVEPDLAIVVDHLGKPPRDAALFSSWRLALVGAAQHDNVVAKLSGLRVTGEPYSVESLTEVWDTALDLFGPKRLLWGSDWPLTVPDGGYAPTLAVLAELVGTLSGDEQQDVWAGTAERVYSLGERK
jgi:L-fuconolactonase